MDLELYNRHREEAKENLRVALKALEDDTADGSIINIAEACGHAERALRGASVLMSMLVERTESKFRANRRAVQIPDHILRTAVADMESIDLPMTAAEIQALCDEGGISRDIVEMGEFATSEREMFLDVIARKFAGRNWPIYGDGDRDSSFSSDLMTGYQKWKAQNGHSGEPA